MMLKQIITTFTKVNTPRLQKPILASFPQRTFMVKPRPALLNFQMIRPSFMSFTQAAETPASHMHRTTSLDNRI